MTSPESVRVGLGERAYDVSVASGLVRRAGTLLRPWLADRRTVIVSDHTVAALHGSNLVGVLKDAGFWVELIEVPPGEGAKTFTELERLCDALLARKLDRSDMIIALGGGVVGDLAGFAAAIYKRGVDFVQIPTTLLAQVDSSVGGKTAIDTPRGKNLIGSFHQPRAVLADLDLLATLPDRQLRAGYAEVLKYGLLGDASFFSWLEANGAGVLALEPVPLAHAVTRSVEMKAQIVVEDERETGRRALLNLGHTFAHALESETGYGEQLLHGEAVALGCTLAFRFSAQLGVCAPQQASRVEAAVRGSALPTRLDQVPGAPFAASRLIDHMFQDKKAQGGALSFILAREVGDAYVAKGIQPAEVRSFLLQEGAL